MKSGHCHHQHHSEGSSLFLGLLDPCLRVPLVPLWSAECPSKLDSRSRHSSTQAPSTPPHVTYKQTLALCLLPPARPPSGWVLAQTTSVLSAFAGAAALAGMLFQCHSPSLPSPLCSKLLFSFNSTHYLQLSKSGPRTSST